MEIYQKNGINPLSSLITPFISLPIFLSVWSAINQTLIIRTGVFVGLDLGVAVSTQVFEFNIGAILLFLLMSAGQILSMKLPMIIRKKQATYKNKEKVEQANKQGSGMMTFMMIMIIFTGFVLPAALAIYWTIGALFSICQTLIFQNPKVKVKIDNFINRKKRAKVVK
jgi:YidC/Oxa1 family membrane protein insertase